MTVSNDAWFGDSDRAAPASGDRARVRAAETGRWLVRATNTGPECGWSRRGERIRARLPQFEIAAGTFRGRPDARRDALRADGGCPDRHRPRAMAGRGLARARGGRPPQCARPRHDLPKCADDGFRRPFHVLDTDMPLGFAVGVDGDGGMDASGHDLAGLEGPGADPRPSPGSRAGRDRSVAGPRAWHRGRRGRRGRERRGVARRRPRRLGREDLQREDAVRDGPAGRPGRGPRDEPRDRLRPVPPAPGRSREDPHPQLDMAGGRGAGGHRRADRRGRRLQRTGLRHPLSSGVRLADPRRELRLGGRAGPRARRGRMPTPTPRATSRCARATGRPGSGSASGATYAPDFRALFERGCPLHSTRSRS